MSKLTIVKTDIPLPKRIPEKYGEAIENLKPELESIVLEEGEREKVFNYTIRKYGDERQYSIRTVNNQIRLYRVK